MFNYMKGMTMNDAAKKQVHAYLNSRKSTPVGLAYELTKSYAGSGNPDSKEIPRLFVSLVELFVDLEDLKTRG